MTNKQRRKSALILFIAYIWSKTLLGLAIHPYKSVRDVSRNKVLVPVVFSPLIGLGVLFVLGRMGSFVFELDGFQRNIMAVVLSSGLIAIVLWQGLLVYLLVSFYVALRKRE